MAEQEKSSEKRHKKSEDVLLLAVSSFVELGGAKNEENARISVCVAQSRTQLCLGWRDFVALGIAGRIIGDFSCYTR